VSANYCETVVHFFFTLVEATAKPTLVHEGQYDYYLRLAAQPHKSGRLQALFKICRS